MDSQGTTLSPPDIDKGSLIEKHNKLLVESLTCTSRHDMWRVVPCTGAQRTRPLSLSLPPTHKHTHTHWCLTDTHPACPPVRRISLSCVHRICVWTYTYGRIGLDIYTHSSTRSPGLLMRLPNQTVGPRGYRERLIL